MALPAKPVSEIEQKQRRAQLELQMGLISAQGVLDAMTAQLQREGISQTKIKNRLRGHGMELEEQLRKAPKLEPDAGSCAAKAIEVNHPLQELMRLREIDATPVCYEREQSEDLKKYYDKYTTMRLVAGEARERKENIVWFDITKEYDKFVAITKRKALPYGVKRQGSSCACCGEARKESGLKACTGCHLVSYCDKLCQKAHWRNGHKDICKGIKKETKRLEKRVKELTAVDEKKVIKPPEA